MYEEVGKLRFKSTMMVFMRIMVLFLVGMDVLYLIG
jgi:predicted nucleic acid-binding Zn ribbon protein